MINQQQVEELWQESIDFKVGCWLVGEQSNADPRKGIIVLRVSSTAKENPQGGKLLNVSWGFELAIELVAKLFLKNYFDLRRILF